MNNKYTIANSIEMDKRNFLVKEFCSTVLDPDEIPFIITDEATLYDIYIGDELELIGKINKKYGVCINLNHFEIPFWKLLDFLNQSIK